MHDGLARRKHALGFAVALGIRQVVDHIFQDLVRRSEAERRRIADIELQDTLARFFHAVRFFQHRAADVITNAVQFFRFADLFHEWLAAAGQEKQRVGYYTLSGWPLIARFVERISMNKIGKKVLHVACLLAGTAMLGQVAQAAQRVEMREIDLAAIRAAGGAGMSVTGQGLQQALQLDPRNSFRQLKQSKDPQGNVHVRYQQLFDGVPLYGEQLVVHGNAGGQVYALTGRAVDGIENDIDAGDTRHQVFAADEAKAKARRRLDRFMRLPAGVAASFRNEKIELMIYLDAKDVAHDVWLVSYVAEASGVAPVRPFFIIDADNGDVLKAWNGMAHASIGTGPGGNERIGQVEYGTDRPFLDVTQVASTCTMNNAAVKTVNMNGGTGDFNAAYSYNCPRNTVKAINGAYSPLNDAHHFGTVTDAMFDAYFGVNPLDFQIVLRVHYDVDYDNAFWDGSYTNFGDGTQTVFYPLASSLNVVAHEVAHGTTEHNSNLQYYGQSGGINESFSDIVGEAAEFYAYGTVDWLVGADVMVGKKKALRYFENPALDKSSIGHAGDYYDGMDVHFSSGVFNRAYFLLANTAGWDPAKAFKVFYYANVNYWVPSSDFVDAACGVLSAAGDLAYDKQPVKAAFQAVGVECPLPVTDVDGDFMDDDWEAANGLNPSVNDASDDPDGDGLSNRQEYFEGTDPQDADTDGDNIADSYDPLPTDGDWLGLVAYDTVFNRGDGAKVLAGSAVASGDVDGDGYDDIIIGAPNYDYKYQRYRYPDIGFVVVVSGKTGSVLWYNIGDNKGQFYGKAVAATSDLDKDGVADFVVGVPGYDPFDYGSYRYVKDVGLVLAYSVFDFDPFTGAAYINAFMGDYAGDRFGSAVAGSGDIDNDGYGDIVIGAPGVDTTDSISLFKDAGAVYVVEVSSGSLIAAYYNGGAKDNYGAAVAGVGDITGDGYEDVIAGAPLADANGKDSGSVFILTPINDSSMPGYFVGDAGQRMGSALAGGADFNADGFPDFLMGYPYANNKSGGVRIVLGKNSPSQLDVLGSIESELPSAMMGFSVAAVEDIDGDGHDEILVGSPGVDVVDNATGKKMADAGRVQLFSGADGSEIWSADGNAAKDYFGWAVASGDVNNDGAGDAVIGAKGDDLPGGTANKPKLVKDTGSVAVINGKAIAP